MSGRKILINWETKYKLSLGNFLRKIGQKFIKKGHSMQGELLAIDKVPLSLRCVPYKNKFPRILESEFIAPNCTIIGDVTSGRESSFFFGVSIRGDTCRVNIGNNTVIQDNTQIYSSLPGDLINKVEIGSNVIIGTNCVIDSAIVKNDAVIGNGSMLHSGVIVESGALVAPGSVVSKNTVVDKNQIWVGNPAKYLRDITPEERQNIKENINELNELAAVLVEETEKTPLEVISNIHSRHDKYYLHPTVRDQMYKNLISYNGEEAYDELGIETTNEGYHDLKEEGQIKYNIYKTLRDETFDNRYDQDLRHYPDYFKIYSENFKRYDEINRRAENIAPGDISGIFEVDRLRPERPEALRAWQSKWDPDYNITFKTVGSKVDSNSK